MANETDEYTTAKMLLHSYLAERESKHPRKKIHFIGDFNDNDTDTYENHVEKFLVKKGIFEIIHEHIQEEIQNNHGDDYSAQVSFNTKTAKFHIEGMRYVTTTVDFEDDFD